MKLRWLALILIPSLAWASVTVTVNGTNYTIPQNNEKGWGTAVTNWIQAISANTLQPNQSVFTLSADLDFGASFGLKSIYYKSRSANIASTGVYRLANTDCITYRNSSNGADLCLKPDADGILQYNGVDLVNLSAAQSLTNKNLTDASVLWINSLDATKKLAWSLGADTTGTTLTVAPAQTTSQTLSIPNVGASDSLVTNNTTATLTNKTISGASNTVSNLAASSISTGQIAQARGGTGADLSATGGAHNVLQQASAGAAVTVGQLGFSDLSGSATGAQLPTTAVQTNQANTYTNGPQSLGNYQLTVQVANDTVTGTTLNKLAKVQSVSPMTAVVTSTSDTTGVYGIVVTGAGITGSADIAREGYASCVFDSSTSAGDYVTLSSGIAGDCHDAGSTRPTATQSIGQVILTHAGASTQTVLLELGASGSSIQAQGQSDGSASSASTLEVPNKQLTNIAQGSYLVETGYHNVLANPEFQATGVTGSVVPGWTLGTGVTVAGNALDATVKNDDQQATLKLTLASAVNEVFYQDVTVASGSVSGVAVENSFYIYNSGNVGFLQVCPRLNGATLTGGSNCQAVPNGGSWFPVAASTVGGSGTTSIGVSLYASALTSGSVWVTHAYVGKNRNIGTVAQAQLLGTVVISGCAASWSTPQTAFTSDYAAQTGCTYTTSGQAIAPATNIPAIKFASIGPGELKLEYEGTYGQQGGANLLAFFQFWDGTNTARETSVFENVAGNGAASTISQSISYSSPQSNVTLSIRGKTTSGGGAQIFGTTAFPGVIRVYYFPSQSQTVASLANASANYSGYLTANSSWGAAGSGYADPSSGSALSLTSVGTPHNITCSAASGTVAGVTCTLPKTGNYDIKAGVNLVQSVATGTASVRLVDGSGTVIDPGKSVSISSGNNGTLQLHGGYTATSTTVTFKVQPATNAGTTSITNGVASGTPAINFTIEAIDSPGPQPYTTGNVSSTGAGQEHAEEALIGGGGGSKTAMTACASGSCVIYRQSGTWLSSITWASTGVYTAAFAPNEFSDVPTCTCTTGDVSVICQTFQTSATQVKIQTGAYASSPASLNVTNSDVKLFCMGPH